MLDTYLAPRGVVHGVLMDILGLGVLIVGESGIGKSECALDLVVRGHRLVADDAVELRCRARVVRDRHLPGADAASHGDPRPRADQRAGSVRRRLDAASKRVELVVQLERWDPAREYDRLGLDEAHYETLGVADPDDPHAGRAGTQPRDPGGSRGAQPAAARRRPSRGAAARRAGSTSSSATRATARTLDFGEDL